MAAQALQSTRETHYSRDLGRAFGGALLFGLPLLMTMEMWGYGLTLDPVRLTVFLLSGLPLLLGLAVFAGFSRNQGIGHAVIDVFAALAVGFVTSGFLLILIGVIDGAAPLRAAVGQIVLQAVPAAMGALLARRQFGADRNDAEKAEARYSGELFLMVAGALFLALNIAPTEETRLIAYRMAPWQAVGLLLLSVGLMHVIVYLAGFAGQEEQGHPLTAFVHFTLAGYGLVLLTGVYVLWLFGALDGHGVFETAKTIVVLGFPGAIGAAAARLLV
jgi:putative integral membrane protein (TIGR02587 family)